MGGGEGGVRARGTVGREYLNQPRAECRSVLEYSGVNERYGYRIEREKRRHKSPVHTTPRQTREPQLITPHDIKTTPFSAWRASLACRIPPQLSRAPITGTTTSPTAAVLRTFLGTEKSLFKRPGGSMGTPRTLPSPSAGNSSATILSPSACSSDC